MSVVKFEAPNPVDAVKAVILVGNTALPMASQGIKFVISAFKHYGESALTEIKILQNLYIENCYQQEKDSPTFTTLFLHETFKLKDFEKKEEESKLYYPMFFQMDEKGELPILYSKYGYQPQKDVQKWSKRLHKKSHFRQDIRDILAYICQYQVDRDQRYYWQDKGYNYDPTNLFFEEFKTWLLMLSCADLISNNTLDSLIQGRINYLSAICDNNKKIFSPDYEVNPTRIQIIHHVKDILIKIFTKAKLMRSQVTSRDLLDNVRLEIKDVFETTTGIIFYAFQDSNILPEELIYDEIRSPSLPCYQNISHTIAFNLLKELLNDTAVKYIFPSSIEQSINCPILVYREDVKKIALPFIGSSAIVVCGKACYFVRCENKKEKKISQKKIELSDESLEKFKKEFNIDNENFDENADYKQVKKFFTEEEWELANSITNYQIISYGLNEKTLIRNLSREDRVKILCAKDNTGLMAGFCNKEVMEKFIVLHELLYKVAQFYLICDTLYDFSGAGGDLAVYGKASVLVMEAFEKFSEILLDVEKNVDFLFKSIEKSQKELQNNKSNNNWLQTVSHTRNSHTAFKDNIQKIKSTIGDINKEIKNFDPQKYIKQMIKKLETLESMVNLFASNNNFIQNNKIQYIEGSKQKLEESKIKELVNEVYELGNKKEGKKIVDKIKQLIVKYPDSPSVNLCMAQVCFGGKKYEDAIKYSDKVVLLENNKFSDNSRQAKLLKIEAYFKLKEIFEDDNKKEEAVLQVEKEFSSLIDEEFLLKMEKEDEKFKGKLFDVNTQLGRYGKFFNSFRLSKQGKLKDAKEELETILNIEKLSESDSKFFKRCVNLKNDITLKQSEYEKKVVINKKN